MWAWNKTIYKMYVDIEMQILKLLLRFEKKLGNPTCYHQHPPPTFGYFPTRPASPRADPSKCHPLTPCLPTGQEEDPVTMMDQSRDGFASKLGLLELLLLKV